MYIITRLQTIGEYGIYKRQWKEPGLLKFTVVKNNETIGEYKTKAQAIKSIKG